MNYSKPSSIAQSRAKTRLVAAHREEYNQYYKEERLKLSQSDESEQGEPDGNATV